MEKNYNNAQALQNSNVKSLTTQKSPPKLFGIELSYIGIVMIIGSFAGWLTENIFRLINAKILDSRYHVLPFIFAYGIAVFAMFLVLGNPNDVHIFGLKIFKSNFKLKKLWSNLIYLAVVILFVGIGEILAGYFYEITTGLSLWNYSHVPLHITKYTSLPTMIAFGFGAWLFMKFIFFPLIHWQQKHMSYKLATFINWTLGLLIAIDGLAMVIILLITKVKPLYWRIIFK